jgi:hypothetical protein
VIFFLFKDAILYWRHNPEAPEQNLLLGVVVTTILFLFCFLQSVFIYFWQATPGQYFLKIRVQFTEPSTWTFWRALLRQIGFGISPLFFGLPWLAMLANPEGKAFYDRLADCQVVTLKNEINAFGFEGESKYWRSVLATLILFVGVLLTAAVWMQYQKVIQRVASFGEASKNNFFCADLKDVQISQRLQMAVAMNLTNQLSDDCLDKEADFALWKEKTEDLSLAYFAKSLTESNNEQEITYLKQACLGEENKAFRDQSFGCQVAGSFQKKQFSELYEKVGSQSGVLASIFRYELGLTLDKTKETAKNFKALEKYDSHRLIKKYLLSEMLNEKTTAPNRRPSSVEESNSSTKIFDAQLADQWMHDL